MSRAGGGPRSPLNGRCLPSSGLAPRQRVINGGDESGDVSLAPSPSFLFLAGAGLGGRASGGRAEYPGAPGRGGLHSTGRSPAGEAGKAKAPGMGGQRQEPRDGSPHHVECVAAASCPRPGQCSRPLSKGARSSEHLLGQQSPGPLLRARGRDKGQNPWAHGELAGARTQ